MPYSDFIAELIAPDYSPHEIDKLIRQFSTKFGSNKHDDEFNQTTILPLLLATKKFLDQTTTEAVFNVFQQFRTEDENIAIYNVITQELNNKTAFLATLDPTKSQAQMLASALAFCSQCVVKRLQESREKV